MLKRNTSIISSSSIIYDNRAAFKIILSKYFITNFTEVIHLVIINRYEDNPIF